MKRGFTFFRKGGRWHGAHVSRSRLLDWNFLGYVLRRGYATGCTTIFRTNRFLRTFKLFKINRAYVYIRIRGIFNCFLHRIYILHDVLTCPWGWTLKGGILPSFF